MNVSTVFAPLIEGVHVTVALEVQVLVKVAVTVVAAARVPEATRLVVPEQLLPEQDHDTA